MDGVVFVPPFSLAGGVFGVAGLGEVPRGEPEAVFAAGLADLGAGLEGGLAFCLATGLAAGLAAGLEVGLAEGLAAGFAFGAGLDAGFGGAAFLGAAGLAVVRAGALDDALAGALALLDFAGLPEASRAGAAAEDAFFAAVFAWAGLPAFAAGGFTVPEEGLAFAFPDDALFPELVAFFFISDFGFAACTMTVVELHSLFWNTVHSIHYTRMSRGESHPGSAGARTRPVRPADPEILVDDECGRRISSCQWTTVHA